MGVVRTPYCFCSPNASRIQLLCYYTALWNCPQLTRHGDVWSPKIFHRKATCRCEVARRAEIEAFRIPSHWNVRQHQESVDRCALSEAHSDAAQHNKIKSSTLANSDSPNGFILCQYGRMLEIEGRQKKKNYLRTECRQWLH